MKTLYVILALFVIGMAWFAFSFSPTQKKFVTDLEKLKAENRLEEGKVFEKSDFDNLPMRFKNILKDAAISVNRK